MRVAIRHPGQVRPGWAVIAAIAERAGVDFGVLTSPMVYRQLVEAVPFYAGITLEEIGGQGVRWPGLPAASAMPAGSDPGERADDAGSASSEPAARNGSLRLG